MATIEDLQELDLTSWLDWMGVDYRRTTGSHGVQLNLRECPFCGNDRWKVYVNEETGLGNCFHGDCERKFNKYQLIKAFLKTENFKDVMANIDQYLEIHGWKPKIEAPQAKNIINETKSFNMPSFIPLPTSDGKNLDYLIKRGITNEATRYFELGYCDDGYFQFKRPDGGLAYQDFSKRVIIPVRDIDGTVVSFQGRDITGTADKKYLFPSGRNSTGTLFYNGHHAVGAKSVVICEGVFDVIAVWMAFQGQNIETIPIGSFGKHISKNNADSQVAYLLKLKEKGLENITFMWDGEPQAIKDACNTALELQKYGFSVRIAILPGKDPNELPPSVVRMCFWNALTVNPRTVMTLKLKYSLK